MTIKLLVIPGWAAPSRGRVAECHAAFCPALGCAHSATSIDVSGRWAATASTRGALIVARPRSSCTSYAAARITTRRRFRQNRRGNARETVCHPPRKSRGRWGWSESR
jgi:hypothetical protein